MPDCSLQVIRKLHQDSWHRSCPPRSQFISGPWRLPPLEIQARRLFSALGVHPSSSGRRQRRWIYLVAKFVAGRVTNMALVDLSRAALLGQRGDSCVCPFLCSSPSTHCCVGKTSSGTPARRPMLHGEEHTDRQTAGWCTQMSNWGQDASPSPSVYIWRAPNSVSSALRRSMVGGRLLRGSVHEHSGQDGRHFEARWYPDVDSARNSARMLSAPLAKAKCPAVWEHPLAKILPYDRSGRSEQQGTAWSDFCLARRFYVNTPMACIRRRCRASPRHRLGFMLIY